MTFIQLKKNLKNDYTNFKKIKIAILGDTATQLLTQALRGTGFNYQLDLEIWEADFNQIERQVFDFASELYEFGPSIVIIFHSSHKLLINYNKLKPADLESLADKQLELVDSMYTTFQTQLKAKIIYFNYTEINL